MFHMYTKFTQELMTLSLKFIQDEICFFFATNSSQDTSSLVWDAFTAYISKKEKQSTCERNDNKSNKEIDLKCAHNQCPGLLRKHLELKTRLDLLATHSAERLLLCDKSNFYVHGDKPEKSLATLLKGSKARQTIPKI